MSHAFGVLNISQLITLRVLNKTVKETFLSEHPGATLAVTLSPLQTFAAGTEVFPLSGKIAVTTVV